MPGQQRSGQVVTDPAEAGQNPPPAADSSDTASGGGPGDYRVLVGAVMVAEDKDGKKTRRYLRGQKVTLGEHVEIDRLLALRAIEPWGRSTIGPSTAMHLSRAANAAAQENEAEFLPDGDDEA